LEEKAGKSNMINVHHTPPDDRENVVKIVAEKNIDNAS